MANQASAELFLDILTKEEKEALLSKKMEEIRKKNDALRKRHEEIQKDKKVADQMTKDTTDSSSKSPTKEKQSYSNDKIHNERPKKNHGKPMGRGKPRPHSGGDYNHVQDMHITRNAESRNVQLKDDPNRFQDEHQFRHETPKRFSFGEQDRPNDFRFGEHDDRDVDYRNDRRSSNQRNFRGRGGRGGHNDHYNRQDSRSSNEGNFRNSGDFSRQDSRGRGRGRNSYDRQDSRSSGEDNFRNSGDFSRIETRGRGNQSNRQGNRYSGEFKRNNYRDKREQFDDADFDGNRKRPYVGSHYHDDRVEGPPPDPAYNFLSDRGREGMQNQERREPQRRHPKNFGGQDFSNVKNQMKNVKDRQHRSGPPKSKMEMTVTMTGKERRQYIEWKADRDRVDNARIERQKSSSGEWKREWDKEKFELEDIKQTEPARRPAQQEEHPRGNPDRSPTKQRGDIPTKGRGGNKHPETTPRMAGRGRGRGKAKSANEAKPPRMRTTSSGDERVVNCHSDLLVIKLENTPGDNSVEVEYSDGEVPVGKSPRGKPVPGAPVGGTATHGAQTEELWWDEDDDLTMSLVQDGLDEDDVLEHRQLFEDADQGAKQDIVVGEDEDEWEDCDDDSFYSNEKSQTSTDSREGYGQLKVNTQLNPDAPEFTPTSPLSPPSPRSPREKRQKLKHGEKTARKNSEAKGQKKGADKKQETGSPTKTTQKGTEKEKGGDKTTDSIDKKGRDVTDQKAHNGTDMSQKLLQDGGDKSKDIEKAEKLPMTGDNKSKSETVVVDNILSESTLTRDDLAKSQSGNETEKVPQKNGEQKVSAEFTKDQGGSVKDTTADGDTSQQDGDVPDITLNGDADIALDSEVPDTNVNGDADITHDSEVPDTKLNGDADITHDSEVPDTKVNGGGSETKQDGNTDTEQDSGIETTTDAGADGTMIEDSLNKNGAESTEQVAKTETEAVLQEQENGSNRTQKEE